MIKTGMTKPWNRRRFLVAAAVAVGTVGTAGAAARTIARWQGRAMGAQASLQIAGISSQEAAPVFAAVEAELRRLEMVFSLFQPQSQLSRLNQEGFLDAPAPELLDVLTLSAGLHDASDGAFDPTVQPVWQALAQGGSAATADVAVGWQYVQFDSRQLRFARAGMGLTLNGIAQGYITDRVAALLRQQGLADVVVDMGEVAASGRRGDGQPWQAGIVAPDGALLHRLALRDRALATSAADGTLIGGSHSHILDPRSGRGAASGRLVSVSAGSAAVADGLSTALCLLPPAAAQDVLGRFPGARLERQV